MESSNQKLQKFYILATSSGLSKESLILKHGEGFAIFDPYGDIRQEGLGEQGLYYEGTRFLSCLELLFCDTRPFLLSSGPTRDNLTVTADLTNPDLILEGNDFLPRGSIHLLRQKFLYEGICYEAIRIENFSPYRIHLPLIIRFGADFLDIFEVRGTKRKQRGSLLPPEVERDAVSLKYLGLDGKLRKTELRFYPVPVHLDYQSALFHIDLASKQRLALYFGVLCYCDQEERDVPFRVAYFATRRDRKEFQHRTCQIITSHEQFNAWLDRSLSDIFIMLTKTPYGVYPYAGIPWFNTAFGRDGLITALECLWINPEIARGVLNFLAATQATKIDPASDAQPGKILHEIRTGEMAATGEIPFAKYYGTIDATPLFIVLAGVYFERTRDLDFVRKLWPHLELAWKWMEEYGDLDGDSFIEYEASDEGLINKGWKDSHDSVFHADGTLAKGPIALVEVQAYAYMAYLYLAAIALALKKRDLSDHFLLKADKLRQHFLKAFWSEKLQTFILALDGEKRPCEVRSSNAGHALFAKIASQDQAERVAQMLLERHFFSGWGIRTLSTKEVLYNPVSYHNGSIWPHDNALIAKGLSRYGFKIYLIKLLRGLFDASTYFHHHRMPELFCGFSRRSDEGPTYYPVACNPQAWAAASVFLLLEACLGIKFTPKGICFYKPILPRFLKLVKIRNLRLREHTVDLDIINHETDVTINVLRKARDIEIMILK